METDTVKLLRECDAGVEMGVSSISDVLERVENERNAFKLQAFTRKTRT